MLLGFDFAVIVTEVCVTYHLLLALKCVPTGSDTLKGEFAEGVNLGGQEDSTLCSATELYTCIPHLRTHKST